MRQIEDIKMYIDAKAKALIISFVAIAIVIKGISMMFETTDEYKANYLFSNGHISYDTVISTDDFLSGEDLEEGIRKQIRKQYDAVTGVRG